VNTDGSMGQSTRDPYSGFRKVFVMPIGSTKEGIKDYETAASQQPSVDLSMNRSAQLGEILMDKQNQSRVVDNVLNFFRYKDPERHQQLFSQTQTMQSIEPKGLHNEVNKEGVVLQSEK